MNERTFHRDAIPILQVEDLRTRFHTPQSAAQSSGMADSVDAVDGVDLTVRRGEIVGLVGESGSGKSVTGYSILGLIDAPGKIVGGKVLFQGEDLRHAGEEALRQIRGNRISMVFQDPLAALHPLLRIGDQMSDAVLAHQRVSRKVAWQKSVDALGKVGIPSPADRMRAYPHQLSGGMRQRVGIAMALLNDPDIVIADEPTTGLDVTIQAQILAQMQLLTQRSGTALIWITHDLSVVSNLADTVAVMYAGRIVEKGPVAQVLGAPAHPYTTGLLNSVPSRNRDAARLPQIPGNVASAAQTGGCRFMPRCPGRRDRCAAVPPLISLSAEHTVRCFFPNQHNAADNTANTNVAGEMQ